MGWMRLCWEMLGCFLLDRTTITIRQMALRQQLAVLKKTGKRPRLKPRDRLFWVLLKCCWKNWQSCLIIVQPETVCHWHRLGFRLFWRWKSTWSKRGRPKINAEIRALIRRMSQENPTWGAPRIQNELSMLGYELAASTVA